MSRAPTVSVAMAAYNSERWIGETIESILAQTRPPDQIVVVDDGSTDETARVLARFGDRLEVVRQPNAGAPRAYNRAFAEARGDYVALASSDDLWDPRKLEWQVEALAANLTLDVTFSHARTFGIEHGDWPRPRGVGVLDRGDLIRQIYPANMICAPSA